MTISLLIVNWNSWDLLSRCLYSLSQQTYTDFQVFVADNASRQPMPDGIFSNFPDLIFVKNDTNLGFAEANNRLLKLITNAEWVVLLNPDAFPAQNWLEQLVSAANEYPDYSFFSSCLRMSADPNISDGNGDVYHVSGLVWRDGHGQTAPAGDAAPMEVFSPCAAAAMYRLSELLHIGGFDKDFFCYVEDVDLGFRLRLAGYKAMHVPGAVVHHVGSATTGGKRSDFSIYYGQRNLVWTFFKNMPGILFWLLLPLHLMMNFAAIIWFTARGQGNVIFRAKWHACKNIPSVWRKRRKIQACRVATCMDIWRVMNKSLTPLFTRKRPKITNNEG